MPAVKTYTRVNFQNYPSTSTPLNATNLNKMDKGIDDLDDEVVTVKNAIENMSFDADSISYDNTSSGLQATDVQDAVDEINDNLTELNDNLNGFTYYPSGAIDLVASVSNNSYYTDANGKYVLADSPTGESLIDNITYKSLASNEDLRGEVGADTVSPFKSKIKIPNIQLYGSDNGSGIRDVISDTEIDTSRYKNLKIGTLTMVNSSSYDEYIMVLGDGIPIWSKSLSSSGSYTDTNIVVDISSVNKLKVRLKISNLNSNCYVYAQNIEIS